MPFFNSSKEKHLWFWAFLVGIAIFSTLWLGRPLSKLWGNQDIQAIIFVVGMLLTGISIFIHAFKKSSSLLKIGVILGIAAVYLLLFLRLGLPERSHLIEYSVLTIFIHQAILERHRHQSIPLNPHLLTFLLAFGIGVLDEGIQWFLPDRVFDINDMVFNGIAITLVIGIYLVFDGIGKLMNQKME